MVICIHNPGDSWTKTYATILYTPSHLSCLWMSPFRIHGTLPKWRQLLDAHSCSLSLSQDRIAFKIQVLFNYFPSKSKTQSKSESIGIIFTSRALLIVLKRVYDGQINCGGVNTSSDGTYKLHHDGWVLIPKGSKGKSYDTKSAQYTQRFYPYIYAFVRSENSLAYQHLFEVFSIYSENNWKVLGF